jgi:hypothetical protein
METPGCLQSGADFILFFKWSACWSFAGFLDWVGVRVSGVSLREKLEKL